MPDYKKMLKECRGDDSALTGWEIEFLESLLKQPYAYTEKQRTVLKRIWDKQTVWRLTGKTDIPSNPSEGPSGRRRSPPRQRPGRGE
jgi:hypothetical protein